ncbi:MAG: hypothetical protein FJ291_32315 [Planctomycetes bacterium]|nr:hypothetical protein [Planctomycetota bacterium]
MGQHRRTVELTALARDILAEHHPMTVRQVFYQLVSRHVIENSLSRYNGVSKLLVEARQSGLIPWDWIEDRLRRPRRVSMWNDLAAFAEAVRASYRRNVWATQPVYIETWVEKDALSGIFEDVLEPYGLTLNVGRGYDGWDSIRNAAGRFQGWDEVTVLYFGDFDPSGDDMVRSLGERLGFFECWPEIVKCALNVEDVERYNLPPALTKPTDTRRAAFVDRYGDMAVELDALPVDVLRERVKAEVESRMDLEALDRTREVEKVEVTRLAAAMRDMAACSGEAEKG